MANVGARGQITLFILLGLLLLFLASLIFYYQLGSYFRERFTPFTEVLPTEVQPFQEYVTKCVEKLTKQAIIILAKQGGYINTSSFAVLPQVPTEGTAIQVADGWTIPYWWSLDSPNTCTGNCRFAAFIPSTEEAEDQIASFVSGKLAQCRGNARENGRPEVSVSVADDAVSVNLFYPMLVSLGGREHELTKFFIRQNVNLPALYQTAQAIVHEQEKQRFLERQAMELVTVYSGLGKEKLPPVSETLFTPQAFYWLAKDVEARLKEILATHMHLFRIKGARNELHRKADVKLPYGAVLTRFYESFIIPITRRMPYEAHFLYFSWPIYFSVNDNKGIVMPEIAAPEILPVPIIVQRYTTVYDFSFPIVLELQDGNALGGDGLSFFFAMEGNVRGNRPMNVTEYTEETFVEGEGMFCDATQRNTQNTTVVMHDEWGEPVKDVLVAFHAGEACVLGATDENGKISGPFPVGMGVLSLAAADIVPYSVPYTVYLDAMQEEKAIVSRMKPVTVQLRTRLLAKTPSWQLGPEGTIMANESVTAIFDRIIEDNEGSFQTIAQFSENMEKQKVSLPSGDYLIKIIFNPNQNITLMPTEQCFGFLEKQCIPLPAEPMMLEAPPFFLEVPLQLSPEEIADEKQVTLYSPRAIFASPAFDDLFIDISPFVPSLLPKK